MENATQTAPDIELVPPREEHEAQALAFVADFRANGEMKMNGSSGLSSSPDYASWLQKVRDRCNPDLETPGLVPCDQYFVIRPRDAKIVGIAQVRRRLTPEMMLGSGHVGYSVCPSERRKGYATRILALALEKCRELPLDRALMICDQGNTGSARTIEKNGGVFQDHITEENGNVVERYWIDLLA